MEAVRTSETSVDNHFTWQYNPEDSSEHHTRRRENLKSHTLQLTVSQPVCLGVKLLLGLVTRFLTVTVFVSWGAPYSWRGCFIGCVLYIEDSPLNTGFLRSRVLSVLEVRGSIIGPETTYPKFFIIIFSGLSCKCCDTLIL
jgi:hypothetical protein